jgi:hypothetical protein
MADGTVCDGGSRGVIMHASKPANGKSEREGEGHGDADGAKGKGDDGKGTADNGKCNGHGGIPKGFDGDDVLHFYPQTNATNEAINYLDLLCGQVGDEGLIYYRCTRCKRRGFGCMEICAMGICGGYRQCAC